MAAFSILGCDASCQAAVAAVPKLIEMYDDHPSRQIEIAKVLACIGPPAKLAVPSLLRGLTNTSVPVRQDAIFALGRIHAEPNTVVPVLIQALSDPDDSVGRSAAGALWEFGTNAKPAVPAIIELVRRERARTIIPEHYDGTAEAALKRIDPEAAASAAIK